MNPKKPTAGIILAAGASTRFGRPKQLLDLGGKPLLEWVVDACLRSRLDRVLVVLGENASQIKAGLSAKYSDPRIRTLISPQYRAGMAFSLKAGLSEVRHDFPAVMFLLGDQPLVSSTLIDDLLEKFWESDKDICVPARRGRYGNPVLLSSRFYHRLLQISGDIGARNIIQSHPEAVLAVEVDNPVVFFDVDTQEDIGVLRKILKRSTSKEGEP